MKSGFNFVVACSILLRWIIVEKSGFSGQPVTGPDIEPGMEKLNLRLE